MSSQNILFLTLFLLRYLCDFPIPNIPNLISLRAQQLPDRNTPLLPTHPSTTCLTSTRDLGDPEEAVDTRFWYLTST